MCRCIYRILETEKNHHAKNKIGRDVAVHFDWPNIFFFQLVIIHRRSEPVASTDIIEWMGKKMWPSRAYTVCVVLSIATTSCVFQQEAHVFHNKISNWIFRGLSRSSLIPSSVEVAGGSLHLCCDNECPPRSNCVDDESKIFPCRKQKLTRVSFTDRLGCKQERCIVLHLISVVDTVAVGVAVCRCLGHIVNCLMLMKL